MIFIKNSKLILNTFIKKLLCLENRIIVKTSTNNLRSLLFFLKTHTLTQFSKLIDIICYDFIGKKFRFTINYILFSHVYNTRITIVIKTNETISILSVSSLFNSANWMEREI